MPRETKADRILKDACDRVSAAQKVVDEKRLAFQDAAAAVKVANSVLEAYQQAYAALEKALTPQPRKKADPKPAAAKESSPTKFIKCGHPDCEDAQSSLIHDPSAGYAGYHPFVSTVTPARTVKRRSSRNTDSSKGAGASPASSETDTGTALDAARAASGD